MELQFIIIANNQHHIIAKQGNDGLILITVVELLSFFLLYHFPYLYIHIVLK